MSAAISLQQAGVCYRRYAKPRDALLEWVLRQTRHQEFHALQQISFDLEQGSSLGIIGDNGAGKSTLLRLLAGNLLPTSGHCIVRGRRSALLELGTGLHGEYSGLENARLGLALRGLDHAAIEAQLPKVLAFAELGDFIEQPVKTYSSGMVVRLVFAVAAVVEPEVLIIDEALAVGDQYFQKKSLDHMRSTLEQGATLVFCSHNLYQVRELCQQALWLEKGQVKMLGESQAVVDAYQDAVRARQTPSQPLAHQLAESKTSSTFPILREVCLRGAQEQAGLLPLFTTWRHFVVEVSAESAGCAIDDIHLGLVIRRNDEIQCYGISTLHDQVPLQAQADGSIKARFVIEKLPLLSGEYCLEVWLIDSSGLHVYDARERCCAFRVQQSTQAQGIGLSWMPHQWEMEAS
ncbi:MAG TPA: ATP-binding cassette domain-containing protein [Thiolinea sp.]|nr:ATP-binding cassette domain-containing protein [Thiolinea sp.]